MITLTASGCTSPDPPPTVEPPSVVHLREAAFVAGLDMGIGWDDIGTTTSVERSLIAKEFNSITSAYSMRWDAIEPEQGLRRYGKADALVSFAESHDMRVRGHTLVWHLVTPSWLGWQCFTPGLPVPDACQSCTAPDGSAWTRLQLLPMLEQYIADVVGRYQGSVDTWDVVNEPLGDENPQLRNSCWYRVIGPDYVELALDAAHRADPSARLFINEYGAEGLGPKSDALYALATDLLARGVALHGIGLQLHNKVGTVPPAEDIRTNVARLNALGLDVEVTELDVGFVWPRDAANAPRNPTTAELDAQAVRYADLVDVCLSALSCPRVTVWGLGDARSWRAPDQPLLFDEELRRKPAYDAVLRVLLQSVLD